MEHEGNTPTSNAATPASEEVSASLTVTAVGPLAPPGGVCLAVDTPTDHLAPAEVTDSIASVSLPVVKDEAAPDDFTPDNDTSSEFVEQALAAAQSFMPGVSKRDGGTTLRYTAADAPLRVESFEAERVAAREAEPAPRAANASFEPSAVSTAASRARPSASRSAPCRRAKP